MRTRCIGIAMSLLLSACGPESQVATGEIKAAILPASGWSNWTTAIYSNQPVMITDRASNNGQCLLAQGGFQWVGVAACDGGNASQQFFFESDGFPSWRVRQSSSAGDLCFDVPNGDSGPQRVQQFPCNNPVSPNQTVGKRGYSGDGRYVFMGFLSDESTVWDLPPFGLQQFPPHGGPNQQWQFSFQCKLADSFCVTGDNCCAGSCPVNMFGFGWCQFGSPG
jgi:Ricin-type beta-trefoil lectin domain